MLPCEGLQKAIAAPVDILFSIFEIPKKFDNMASVGVTIYSNQMKKTNPPLPGPKESPSPPALAFPFS